MRAVRQSMRFIRQALGSSIIDPTLLTSAERLQYEGYCRWEEAGAIIRALAAEGKSIKEIVRLAGLARSTYYDCPQKRANEMAIVEKMLGSATSSRRMAIAVARRALRQQALPRSGMDDTEL